MIILNLDLKCLCPLSRVPCQKFYGLRGRVGVGERAWHLPLSVNIIELPGVARRLVTFLASPRQRVAVEANLQVMPEPKVTKRRRSPIRHLFEVPCVARLARLPHKLARSAARPRAQTCWLRHNLKVSLHRNKSLRAVLSSEFPDQSVLLGGEQGEMMKRTSDKFNFVIPAQAGIQQDKKTFYLNALDSRLRGNDETLEGLCNG